VIVQVGFSLLEAETPADVEDGYDPALQVDYAQNDIRSVRQRRYLHHPHDPLYDGKAQGVTLLIEGESNQYGIFSSSSCHPISRIINIGIRSEIV
jgi:hypothetical protein